MPEEQNPLKRWLSMSVQFFKPPAPIAPGLHHAMREVDGAYTRLHLRVENDSTGMLMANSHAAARLSSSGVVIAKGLLDGKSDDDILSELKARFRGATPEVMRQDLEKVRTLLTRIVTPGTDYPIINFDDAFSVYEARLIAPLKADVPLAPPDQLVPIIDELWKIGVPNMTILVPQNPEAGHIVRAIERAEDLGMIAGVRGRGSDLTQGTLLHDMAMAGVDYITVLYLAADATLHDGLCGQGDHEAAQRVIRESLSNEVCPSAEIALLEPTFEVLPDTLQALQGAQIGHFSFFTLIDPTEELAEGETIKGDRQGAFPARAMPQIRLMLDELADEMQLRFSLQPSVTYDPSRTLADHVLAGPRCSGDVVVRVEPDGSVIPAHGEYQSAGNLLTEQWEYIWQNEAFRIYRERVKKPEEDILTEG